MKPQTELQKNIGIFFGCVIPCAVLAVTIFNATQSSVTPASQLTSTSSNMSSSSDNTQTPVASNPTTPKTIPKIIPKTTPTTTPKPVVTQTPPIDTPKKSSSVYVDGTYSATGSYISPGGYQQLGVSITLKNDIIVSASVTNMAVDGRSQRYQNMFISGYQQYVIREKYRGCAFD